jgi:hypothetical protein
MTGRPTIRSIEPYIYTLYMLVLHDNISLERALKMDADDCKFTNEKNLYVSHKEYIRSQIGSHLKDFWKAQGLLQTSKSAEVLEFIKKHQRIGIFGRMGRWIKNHITLGP